MAVKGWSVDRSVITVYRLIGPDVTVNTGGDSCAASLSYLRAASVDFDALGA